MVVNLLGQKCKLCWSRRWIDLVREFVNAYRTTKLPEIRLSPFEILYHRKPSDMAINLEPEKAIIPQPKKAVTTQPEMAIDLETEKAIIPRPKKAVTTQPEMAINSEPEKAVTEQPEMAINSEPKNAVTAQPKNSNSSTSAGSDEVVSEWSNNWDIEEERINGPAKILEILPNGLAKIQFEDGKEIKIKLAELKVRSNSVTAEAIEVVTMKAAAIKKKASPKRFFMMERIPKSTFSYKVTSRLKD